ncbi:MAG: hypothetical protein J3R72DRAFT_463642 [Linnemannia gamsii]|nr:MAG: hypothetical protein J3R72DRAFT_463642 [Linnemannia gamsii]
MASKPSYCPTDSSSSTSNTPLRHPPPATNSTASPLTPRSSYYGAGANPLKSESYAASERKQPPNINHHHNHNDPSNPTPLYERILSSTSFRVIHGIAVIYFWFIWAPLGPPLDYFFGSSDPWTILEKFVTGLARGVRSMVVGLLCFLGFVFLVVLGIMYVTSTPPWPISVPTQPTTAPTDTSSDTQATKQRLSRDGPPTNPTSTPHQIQHSPSTSTSTSTSTSSSGRGKPF